jgi:hypothetical protein
MRDLPTLRTERGESPWNRGTGRGRSSCGGAEWLVVQDFTAELEKHHRGDLDHAEKIVVDKVGT